MTTAGALLPSAPARILVRGVNWLGDAIMTTPALQRLRERFPQAHISLLTHQKLTDLWLNHPSLDRVLTFTPDDTVWSIARRVRPERFDLALVLPNSPRSAVEAWFAGIPARVGLARPWRNFFLTRPVAPRAGHLPMRKRSVGEIKSLISSTAPRPHAETGLLSTASPHHLHQYLHLAAALGANSEPVPPLVSVASDELQSTAAKFGLGDSGAGRTPILALNPGAEYGPAKRWPAEGFIEAAREVQQRTNCTWLILGGPADLPIATQIHSALRTPPSALLLAGKTSLRELMALLKLSRVLLTNDSGPMHLAAALGTTVVAPFGSTSPELTGPGLPGDPRHHLLVANAPCSPCFLRACPIDFRCMTAIPASRVITAILQSLS